MNNNTDEVGYLPVLQNAEPIPRAEDAMLMAAEVVIGFFAFAAVVIVAHFVCANWPIISALIF